AVATSLLLNLEALFTILVAVALFGEHLGRRSAAASVIVLAGAAFLGYRSGGAQGEWLGALAVAGATLAWAIDNNLTQKLSLRDPVAVTRWKTLGAGACTLALALATGRTLPRGPALGASLLLGLASYGI